MKKADIEALKPGTICDFCSEPLITEPKLYNAQKLAVIPLDDGIMYDDGEWLACPICSELKDSNRWEELLVRCANSLMKVNKLPQDETEETKVLLKLIWHNSFGVVFE